ncbi:MAG: hypothetical protein M3352_04325 [Bacteroidota bacterium]|nr:hypothetical protein [Bacteroidota bacterium]
MEEKFSPQESLQLIQSMIEKTKENISENRFFFLLWGWITFIAVLTQFILKVVVDYKHHYIVWLSVIPAAIITIVKGNKMKARSYRTYVGESMGFLWMGIGISFFILSIIISTSIGWMKAWPFFILFYGLGTFISGKFIQFKPLVFGGVFCWIIACITVFVPYDYQLLLAALAILCSYIIPGYLIKSEKQNNYGT